MTWIRKIHQTTATFSLEKKRQKQFLWLVSIILVSLFGYSFYTHNPNYLFLIISCCTFVLSFIFPVLTLPFLYIWMLIGNVLSEITSTLTLGVMYFLVLTPIRFIKPNKQQSEGWIIPEKETNFNEQF